MWSEEVKYIVPKMNIDNQIRYWAKLINEDIQDDDYQNLERLVGDNFEKDVISEIDDIEIPSPSGDPQDSKSYLAKNVIDEEYVWEKAQEIFEEHKGNISRDELLKKTAEAVEEDFVDREYKEWQAEYFKGISRSKPRIVKLEEDDGEDLNS